VNKNTGFTLIEVLIAMLVLAVGLLGLAALQVSGLRNVQSAYNRSIANELAYDLVDRMRANIPGKATYISGPATQIVNCENTVGCTSAQMAKNDLYEWHLAVNTNLPSGTSSVTVVANVYTITMSWDDNHDGIADLSFITRFQI
jgi:type IV pilus assembly protein PilV